MSDSPRAPLPRLVVVIPLRAVALSVVVFVAVGAVLYLGALDSATHQAEEAADQVAVLSRARLEQVMQSGASREVLERAAAAIVASLADSGTYAIHLHPGKATSTPQPPSRRLAWVYATGRATTGREGSRYAAFFPVEARRSCLSCHSGASEGEMLAVLEVSHDLAPDLAPQRNRLLLILLALLPLPLLASWGGARLVTTRLSRAVRTLRQSTRKVADGEDLSPSDLSPDLAFEELERMFAEVRGLTGVLQDARDLRGQVAALDAMTLSADPAADWRHEVAHMTAAMRRALPVRAVVSAFALADGRREVVVFWNGAATDGEREAMVGITRDKWSGQGAAPEPQAFEHWDVPLPEADADSAPELEHCRTLFFGLQVPQAGGATLVGLAVAEGFTARPLAFRGVLAALLSTVGALRAIDGYLRQIEYHATRDALTELPNRRMFGELLSYEVERARRRDYCFAVAVVDLDGFKQVNDTWGHAFGDRFLVSVAEALRGAARTEDVVARYGGDEFVMLASGADAESVRTLGRRLLDRLATFSMPAPDGTPVGASASIGAAVYPEHGKTADELFRRADTEMYRAKAAGKGCLRIAGEC